MSSKGQGGMAHNKVLTMPNFVPNTKYEVIEQKSNIKLAFFFL